MDKNSIIGFVLIALVMGGFFFYQSNQNKRMMAWQQYQDSLETARQDSIRAAYLAEHPEDSLVLAGGEVPSVADAPAAAPKAVVFSDSLLNAASSAEESFYSLENSKLAIKFTSRGAQPYSVQVKDFLTYDKEPLFLIPEGASELGFVVYAPMALDTRLFNFTVAEEECNDTTLVMRLPISAGGYVEQKYVLEPDSYSVKETLAFVGMNIPYNAGSIDVDFSAMIPRLEKGYKNESQYSRLNYYFPDDKKPANIGNGRKGSKRFSNKVEWFAFQQQFFSAIMRAPQNFTYGDFAVEFMGKDNPDHQLMSCKAQMRADIETGRERVEVPFEFYFGPNSYKGLKAYGHKYEKVIPLGGKVIGLITRFVIIPLFDWLHRGISNFGIIILLMTIFIKIVVLPFAFKSYSSSAKMQALKPFIDKINAKYPKQEDAMKKQQETMDLYKKAGVNMMGGCLPMLFQLPILWAMFRFFPASIELRQQGFLWAEDLSAYDDVIHWGFSVLGMDHISLFALLMALSMFFYTKITMQNQNTGDDPNAKMMRVMSLYMMPIMMFFVCNNLSSALSYYYLLSNIITMIETWIIKKWFVHPEEIIAKVKAAENKPAPKSKWQQRLEEAQKMQRQMQQQQNKRR